MKGAANDFEYAGDMRPTEMINQDRYRLRIIPIRMHRSYGADAKSQALLVELRPTCARPLGTQPRGSLVFSRSSFLCGDVLGVVRHQLRELGCSQGFATFRHSDSSRSTGKTIAYSVTVSQSSRLSGSCGWPGGEVCGPPSDALRKPLDWARSQDLPRARCTRACPASP